MFGTILSAMKRCSLEDGGLNGFARRAGGGKNGVLQVRG